VKALLTCLRCDSCGGLAVAINGVRVTGHKCGGTLTEFHRESVNGIDLVSALGPTTLAQATEREIEAALARNAGNKMAAARELGIDRRTLYRRLETGRAPWGRRDGKGGGS
jgi:transcriptional regulator of acetoin/glycerol metabolism